MRKTFISISLVLGLLSLVACKNETEKQVEPKEEKKELSTKEQQKINSVMTKAMVTPELKTFSSATVTTGLNDMLSNEKGPYTILAPVNDAFDAIPEEEMKVLLNPKSLEKFTRIMKAHVVRGEFDSAFLVQAIKDEGGRYTLTAMAGVPIYASMEGNDIVLTLLSGDKAIIGKSDIKGSNGVVHLIDKVLINIH